MDLKLDGKEKKDLLIILFGALLVLIYFFITKILVQQFQTIIPNSYEYFQLLYWIGFILVLTPLIFFYSKSSTKIKVISVMIFVALILFSYPLLASYNHIYNRDVLYNYQVASLYLENQHLVYDGATGQAEQYIKYPGVPLIHALTSLLTGIDLEMIYLFLLPLIRLLLMPAIIYLILSQFFSKNLSILGVFLYFSSFSIKTHIHNETLAVIFLFLIVYFYLNEKIKFRKTLIIICAILILLIHHFTFYILLLGIILLIILNTYKYKLALILYPLIVLGGLFIVFIIPSLNNSFLFYINLIIESITNMISNGLVHDITLLLSKSNGINFNILEILFVLSAVGILFFLIGYSTKKAFEIRLNKIKRIIVISLIITLITLPLLLTREYFIPLRIFELTLIGLIPIMIYSFESIYNKNSKLVLSLLIILFIGGNLLIVGAQQRAFYNNTTITHNPANGITELFVYPEVLNQRADGYVLSDLLISDIYGGYFGLNIYYYPLDFTKEVFVGQEIEDKSINQLKGYNYSYIVLHKYMLIDINDLFGQTLNQQAYSKFNLQNHIDRIYTTEMITIYWIN